MTKTSIVNPQEFKKAIYCFMCDDDFNITTDDIVIVECRILGEFVCDKFAARCPECKRVHKIDEESLPDFVKENILKLYNKAALRKHK